MEQILIALSSLALACRVACAADSTTLSDFSGNLVQVTGSATMHSTNGDQVNNLGTFYDTLIPSGAASNLLSMTNSALVGACFNPKSNTCTTEKNAKDFFIAQATADGSPADPSTLSTIPANTSIKTTTHYQIQGTSLIVDIQQQGVGIEENLNEHFTVTVAPGFTTKKLRLNHGEDALGTRCSDVSQVPGPIQQLASSVIQILGKSTIDQIDPSASGRGTGFFLSANGLLVTDHHVVDGLQDCEDNLGCKLEFRQTLSNGSVKDFTAKAQIYAQSSDSDFALLKLDLPPSVKVTALQIESGDIESKLVTLGFPGDKMTANGDTPLTFATGNLQGLYGMGYRTTVRISEGASGSPVLNENDNLVIGIASNSMDALSNGDGAPAVARPITPIDSEYGLSDYVSGVKQTRIQSIVQKLSQTTDPVAAQTLISAYLSEKTYLGLDQMKDILISSPSQEVRSEVLKALEQEHVLSGR